MTLFIKRFLPLACLVLAAGCKKEVETVTVQVDKVYSWMPVKQLWGNQTTILGMTAGANTVNIQTIGRFEVLSPLPGSPELVQNGYYTGLGKSRTWFGDPTPFDIRNRIPMNASFYANPGGYQEVVSDTILSIYPTAYFDRPAYLRLRQLDSHAVQFENNLAGSPYPFGAINRNNYLLCSYYTDNSAANKGFNLVLTKLSTGPAPTLPLANTRTQLSSQLIRVPTADPSERQVKKIWAVDDYFLVWCTYAGLYKVQQDGTATQLNGPNNPTAIYKWQGTVYAIQPTSSGTTVYSSTTDGNTWQQVVGFNQGLALSTFYPVGDSLVGITHGLVTNNLYTLRWLNATTIRMRALKTDGLGYTDFADLVPLGDTVYVGTTNGLFKRPLKQFFESK